MAQSARIPPDSLRVLDKVGLLIALGISEQTYNRLNARGDLPESVQLSPRRVGYRVSAIERWLDARTRRPELARVLRQIGSAHSRADLPNIDESNFSEFELEQIADAVAEVPE
jgi:predicted DNA-binding transcriptional regulator AlpA